MNPLEKKLIAAIGAVVLLLIVAGTIAFRALNDSIELNGQVSNTQEILTEVESTLLALKEAEADQREFVATGRSAARDRFHLKRAAAKKKIERLKVITSDHSRHQQRLAKTEVAVDQKLDELRETVRIKEEELRSTTTETSDLENQRTDEIGTLLGEMRAEENGALQTRMDLSEKSIRNVTISFGSLFLLIFALLTLVFFLVRRDLVTQKELQERLTELASVDELTKLYNRREINRYFEYSVERYRRFDEPFSLIMLDIDHFKSVNDTHGHPVGDRVLQQVANTIRDGVRVIDLPGRFGGEEFAVILPNTHSSDAYILAERLRQKIAHEPIRLEQPDSSVLEVSVTVSLGISEIVQKEETDVEVIRRADSALYEAKTEGRNRTVVFAYEETPSVTNSVESAPAHV